MGQQASSPDEVASEPAAGTSTSPSRRYGCCGTPNIHPDVAQPDRTRDCVVIGHLAIPAQVNPPIKAEGQTPVVESAVAQLPLQKPRKPPASRFACSFSLAPGPEVEVTDIEPRGATVKWSQLQGVRKFHLEVLQLPSKAGATVDTQAAEVGFFEVDGECTSLQLPQGTLDRASGPYQVQVTAEMGTDERAWCTAAGKSGPFCTPPEPPGPVVDLRLKGPVTENEIHVEWDAPLDDGGSRVEDYEVSLWKEPDGVDPQRWSTSSRTYLFGELPPGAGPFRIQVCARTSQGLPGTAAWMEACTAVAAPSRPTLLRARLLPGFVGGTSPTPFGLTGTSQADDLDIVRLEFCAPVEDGGRPLESFLVYAKEERASDKGFADAWAPCAEKPVDEPEPSCCVPATSVTRTGNECMCDVAVEPNCAYTFCVEAFNGVCGSGVGEPTPQVFIPARVPGPPRSPPEVFRVEGGFAAELRWIGPTTGGGLPLQSFKIGVLGGLAERGDELDVQREVTVTCSAALARASECYSGVDWHSLQGERQQALYAARVDGLQADARYCFLLAASNALGTGRWSPPSSPVWTPVAAPAAPVNAVATVTLDSAQRVAVTVTWECGKGCAGSGSLSAFHLMFMPTRTRTSIVGADAHSSDSVIRERIAVSGATAGRRLTWATTVCNPGTYVVEVVSENSAGQRSPPTVLAFDVRAEAFLPQLPERTGSPRWADEPVLILGPSQFSEARPFTDIDETGQWLQALLLWHDGDIEPAVQPGLMRISSTLAAPIDVLCHYRRPGSGKAMAIVLASGVTTSRLQVALPAHVPMSLRLAVHAEGSTTVHGKISGPLRSEPLLLLMSEGSEQLKPVWELWSRNSPDGHPSRWIELPEALQSNLEAAWLEGQHKVAFDLTPVVGGGLAPGRYELVFGDERQTQHSVRLLRPGGWTAKARRSVRDSTGEEAAAPAVPAEEQCIICMERRRTHAFMHSDSGDGHLAICGSCAEAFRAELAVDGAAPSVRTCPMCRRPFSAVHRIFQ